MPRRNFFALAMIGSVSLFCWHATQGAKPKDEMLELYGLFVDAAEEPETIPITRAIIDVPSVLGDHRRPDDRWDFLLDHDKKIGYIRISSFIQNTAEDLKKVLDELKDEGLKGLILDLRNDPGGLLSAAVEVADLFLDDSDPTLKGEIVSTKGRNTAPKAYKAQKDSPYEQLPMVVLVN